MNVCLDELFKNTGFFTTYIIFKGHCVFGNDCMEIGKTSIQGGPPTSYNWGYNPHK